jgi:FkbM family methyltransferase
MQTDRAASLPARMHVKHGETGFEVIANDGGELKFWQSFNSGNWETDTLDIIQHHTGPPVHFVDIGSWIGPTALHAAAQGASVTIVEADPLALAQLRRNIALNPALARLIRVVDKALSPVQGHIRFGSRRTGGDSMSSLVHDAMKTAWEVDTILPAELAALCPPGKRTFLKIDIEGGEYVVLPGAGELFALPLAGVHLSLHPQFLLGQSTGIARLGRWLKAARATAVIFRRLSHMKVFRSNRSGVVPAPYVRLLARLGLCFWPLKGSWLFLPK